MKPLAMLACDKIIVDKEGTHSLISVIMDAAVKVQEGQPGKPPRDIDVPANAVAPHQWGIYAQWEPSSDDVGKSFVAVFQVFWPNGERLIEQKLPFTQANNKVQQTTLTIAGFPVGQQGRVKIVAWLNSPDGHKVSDGIETHVNIEHLGAVVPAALPNFTFGFGPKP
jgi:hypothetical protein